MKKKLIKPIVPYTFAELLQLKPGCLIGGMAKDPNGWGPAPAWDKDKAKLLNYEPGKPGVLNYMCVAEKHVQWRMRFVDIRQTCKSSFVYAPNISPLELFNAETNADVWITCKFEHNKPIGMYLGHILRFFGVTYINILSPEGYNVWMIG